MNQELLGNLLQNALSRINNEDLNPSKKAGLVAKVMEVVETGTNLPGSEKKKYAMELVKMVYNQLGLANIVVDGEELGETIDLLVSVSKGVYELQKKGRRWLKLCCRKN